MDRSFEAADGPNKSRTPRSLLVDAFTGERTIGVPAKAAGPAGGVSGGYKGAHHMSIHVLTAQDAGGDKWRCRTTPRRSPISPNESVALADHIKANLGEMRVAIGHSDTGVPSAKTWSCQGSASLSALRNHLISKGVKAAVALEIDGSAWSCPIDEAFDSLSALWTDRHGSWLVSLSDNRIVATGTQLMDFSLPD